MLGLFNFSSSNATFINSKGNKSWFAIPALLEWQRRDAVDRKTDISNLKICHTYEELFIRMTVATLL